MRKVDFVALLGLISLTGACAFAQGSQKDSAPGFRVRGDVEAPLNADTGWAGAPGESVIVQADRPFRLRMLAEASERPGQTRAYGLQVRRNDGPWVQVTAHDFPRSEREVVITFEDAEPGPVPPDWEVVPSGASAHIDTGDRASGLLIEAGKRDVFAFYTPPWALDDFSLGAQFRLDEISSQGVDLVFGYVDADNYAYVRFDPSSDQIRVVRVRDGDATLLARESVAIEAGKRLEAEVQAEDGELEVNFDDDAFEFAIDQPEELPAERVGLRVPGGERVLFPEFVVEGEPRTPSVSIVSALTYADGTPTEPILGVPGVARGFGVSLSKTTPDWTVNPGERGEFEWPLVVRRFADGAHMNDAGDVFTFRMVDETGARVNVGPDPSLTLAVPDGHLGGTFVETPGRIGPWQAANGDLYFIMEPTETTNLFMMVKSGDGGRTWREVDGANRPSTGDLESVDARMVGDTIHIVHQVTESVRYHAFHTSSHSERGDSWAVRDELAATDTAVAQMATLATRSDGSLVVVFLADTLHYAVRSAEGTWSRAKSLDTDADGMTAGPQAVRGADDRIHIAYYESPGAIWHRVLESDGTLSERRLIAEGAGKGSEVYGAVLPLVYLNQTGTLVIVYRLDDGTLWERRIEGGRGPSDPVRVTDLNVITNAVDSQQPAADVISDGDTLHALFVETASRNLFGTCDAGGWTMPRPVVEDVTGSWVRGNVYTRPDGTSVYGFVYDAGSEGGGGLNRFREIELDPGDETC